MKLEYKNIVVMGGCSGIGLALVNALYHIAGTKIAIIDIDDSVLRRLQDGHADRILTLRCDLTDRAQIEETFGALLDPKTILNGEIDLFISVAGMGYYETFDHTDLAHIEKIFALNVFAPIYALGRMAAHQKARPFHFVIVSSAVAQVPVAGYSLYSSTKAARSNFVRAYQLEKPAHISISCVYPVAVKTPFYSKAGPDAKIPLVRQSMRGTVRGILDGIQQDKVEIYPSKLYRGMRAVKRLIPAAVTPYNKLEQHRFQQWRKNHTKKYP